MKFTKAQFKEHDQIEFTIDSDFNQPKLQISHLEDQLFPTVTVNGRFYSISSLPVGGYGIIIKDDTHFEEGAFDVVSSEKDIVRYGFLSDFSESDDDTADVDWMKDLHINAIQFYDWMYKHDDLICTQDSYTDPLGRNTSLSSIKAKIDRCKQLGIRPFAYGAVYAATKSTFEKHPDWAMYTFDKKPMTFAGWLYYMNISDKSGWSDHIVNEFKKTIGFGFSGIHMDTYGFPKLVRDFNGNAVDLSEHFPTLIDHSAAAVSSIDPSGGVIFNAVNNWPVEAVSGSDQDSVYIEVWPPNDTYYDLYTLIREAKIYSKKNVILAAYLKAFKENDVKSAERSFKLAFASICASGGTQLVLGENKCVLSDSYYADHSSISDDFATEVQKYCDYLVRYNELLYNDTGSDISRTAADGINEDIVFISDNVSFSSNGSSNTVWTIIRKSSSMITINMINLVGINNRWNEPKEEPTHTGEFMIRLRLDRNVKGFFFATPDEDTLSAKCLNYSINDNTDQGRIYEITVPSVHYFSTIWARTED